MIGKAISHYQILQKIGEGGMGVVYKARDTHLDRFIALKVLPPGKVADPERRRRFAQEARAASALNHPNIVHIYDIASFEGIDFIAMELIPGKTLEQIIARKGLPLKEVLNYAVQMADALARAHAAGIVHRDLKPSNVMIAEQDLVKVLDFGLAKIAERPGTDEFAATETVQIDQKPRTVEGTIIGTVAYMSPEQAEGKPVDARSDIFSFGSLLYEMITGKRAFRGDTNMSTVAAILREEIKPAGQIVEGLPREFERVISRCLRKQPERRFQHMEDLRIALEELKEESVSGALAIAPTRSSKHTRRRWMASLAGVAAVAGLATWWWITRRAPEPVLQAVPFTTYPGAEENATFSPDGNQVAFRWNGEKQDNYDIYVRLIGPGSPLRLTSHPEMDFSPAWAPDGRSVAFVRIGSPKWEVLLIPALGGTERKLTDTDCKTNVLPMLSWSPDGKWLALPDRDSPAHPCSIYLVSMDSNERRKLTNPPQAFAIGDRTPAFSIDGRELAFSRSVLDTISDLHVVNLSKDYQPASEPRQLTFSKGYIPVPTWSPDGREIIYSTGTWGDQNLWRVAASGGSPPRRLSVGEQSSEPTISPRARRLLYTREMDDINIWRVELSGGPTPKVSSDGAATSLIASTRMDHTPDYSPDGKKIAFSSNRSGSWEIWVCDSHGENASQLTFLGGPFTRFPNWSPDGQRIIFDARVEGQADIYVVDSRGGRPTRLTSSPASDTAPTWSRDGRWIYFSSNRSGEPRIWKMRLGTLPENAVQVTKHPGNFAIEAFDRKHIYFKSLDAVWSAPGPEGDPGEDEKQILPERASEFALGAHGIYFIGSVRAQREQWIQFYGFDSGQVVPLMALRKLTHMGLSVSSDERYLLYCQYDQVGRDLMLVENFR